MKTSTLTTTLCTIAFGFASVSVQADTLKFHTYNPQQNGIFPVSSVIVEGDKEVLLVDAQFQQNDAKALVEQIKTIGKPLKTIYISHGDPDYYFGLDVITQAFPNAEVLATAETVAHIKKTIIAKYDHWSPILADNAPKALVLPKPIQGDVLMVGSSRLDIKGKQDPSHTYLWDNDSRTLLGGVQLYQNMHVWLADAQSKQERSAWQQNLREMQSLNPKTVIAGHYFATSTPDAIHFTQRYLQRVEQALATSRTSSQMIEKMKKAYPNLDGESDLETSAKVLTGEMAW